ncbi:hypothetical protein GOHSU_36_00140 [Gordonia hirsuta DSM 44140 = NBRC 16056]|uniref:Uncharacterized protein n=1 Tax=Gordonia hirsuta DSM 44140 = NBRC 16056 TaxID=1121927 RepID=L7LBZ7_9ACTN|nr:type IV toxin-antitoxin system AbiEi family antitoxin domain-containing protein [Gordonia hirsuta]GAC58271.1 hypothetical protein GOHSU_36_00140 [Gordonia hirsuta DSM 44140 = NBRC 16056]
MGTGIDLDSLNDTLAQNQGVITLAQARSCGLTDRQIYRRVKSGHWEAFARGVFLSRQHLHTDDSRVRAAVWAHRRSVADRSTAAWWHGMLPTLPQPLTICVPRTTHRSPDLPDKASLLHRSIPAEDLLELRGLAVTGAELTVLGALDVVADPPGFLDRVLQQETVTLEGLAQCLDRNRGMHGNGKGRTLLGTLVAGAESEAERVLVELLRLHQITGWTLQYPLGGRRIDVAWPAERIAVEVNGWAYHRDRDRFEADNAKTAMLAARGWLTLSFTWRQLTEEPEDCIAQIAAALALRR